MRYTRSETRVTVRHDEEISTFDITGYFTEDSAEGINAAYNQSANAAKILLRFDRQSFITSSGFGVIVKLIWKTRNRGQVLRVAHPSNQMRHIFDVIGLSQSIDIFASEEKALADF
jgi:anti-anti-sigma factor